MTGSPGWSISPHSHRTRRDLTKSAGQVPVTDVFSYIEVEDGRIWMRPEGVACFAGDLPGRSKSSSGRPTFRRTRTCSARRLTGIAWRSKPSWYIVATNDRTVQPELERFAAKRMEATTYEVGSSHVAMLSNPGLVLDVIRAAANGI